MNRKIYILLLLVFSFLLGPTQTFASPMQTDMACCKDSSTEMSCCKDDKKASDSEMDCGSSCKSASCVCPVVTISPNVLFSENENEALFTFSDKKQNYPNAEILISSDFRSIWLPPKLG
ncbi:hypothetical protein [Myroides guanonis]|nr:hypothetical protein [Myroides guanonis]